MSRFKEGFGLEKINISNELNKEKMAAKMVHELPVLRARLGLSQAELAERIGISRQTYNSYETGKKEMPWITFMALIAVFQNNDETRKMLAFVETGE